MYWRVSAVMSVCNRIVRVRPGRASLISILEIRLWDDCRKQNYHRAVAFQTIEGLPTSGFRRFLADSITISYEFFTF